jgi:lipopolysaccharide export system protein LptA
VTAWLKPAGWLLLVLLGFYFPTAAPAWGQKAQKTGEKVWKPGEKEASKETPIHITASRLEADQTKGEVLFSGQVKAVQGDSILYCDQLWVYYQVAPPPQKPGAAASDSPLEGQAAAVKTPEAKQSSPLGDMGGEKISHIVARGQVRYVQEDRVATGTEATYYKDRDEVVLVGNPQMWRGENTMKGEKIIFNLGKNTVQVESSPQKRVEAHLYPSAQSPAGEKGPLPFGSKSPQGQKPPKGGKTRSQP